MRAAVLLLANTALALVLDVPAGAGSLEHAQERVRAELRSRRQRLRGGGGDGGGACPGDDIVVQLGSGRHRGGIVLTQDDAGIPGCCRVVWRGTGTGDDTVLDGGLAVDTPWTLVDRALNLWSTPAPASLLSPAVLPARTFYVGGVRYNRTRDAASAVGVLGSNNSKITADGWEVASRAPLSWTDPTSVEMVYQGAFTMTRCPVAAVTALAPTPPPAPPAVPGTCAWGQQLSGRSPGSTTAAIANVSTYAECQAECCKREHASPPCTAVLYKDGSDLCYLADRDVLPGFTPTSGMYVANMNPAPVQYRAAISVAQPCLKTTKGYKFSDHGYPDYFENTGHFDSPGSGQFYIDRTKGLVLATLRAEHTPAAAAVAAASGGAVALPAGVSAVFGMQELLLDVHDTHDVEWHNVTFAHTAWTQADAPGFVERFSNLYLPLGDDAPRGYRVPAAAVVVQRSRRVVFDGCTWTRLGAWALRVQNASQDVEVRYCTFFDLSGGAVMLGSPQENEAGPAMQLARIAVTDNNMTRLSMEYTGAAAVHSMVVANSTLAHNVISDVGYCAISWNWPAVQGPTYPYPPTNPALGFQMNNVVANNDASGFMRGTSDGGGIHSVGYGGNTTYSGNYFHDVQAAAVSILYIDNWGAGFQLNGNVVDNCPNTAMGYYYFQSIASCPAHDNYVDGLWARNAGNPAAHGLPCNCTDAHEVPIGSPWPAAAQAIIDNAGPRPRS